MSEWTDQFRIDFPEFAHSSPEVFEDSLIEFWADLGEAIVDNTGRFLNATIRNLALELFVAHHVITAFNNEQAVAAEDYSGQGVRPIASNSVGDVSVSYDLSRMTEEQAGEYNSTTYGRKLFSMINIFGVGGAIVI